ncbi:MAG: tetratricopeptide repeat protein, partial [Verrucomicrobiales bacterium]
TARGLLENPPQGTLFAQLPFIVGDCLFRQEKWQPAVASLQSFVAPRIAGGKVVADPNVDTALMQLAVAYERIGKKTLAREQLGLLLDQYPQPTPHLPLALTEQGRLAYEDNDLKTARSAFERFIAEDGKDAEPFKGNAAAQRIRVMYYLGWVDAKEGQNDSAATRFSRVVEIDKKHQLAPDAALQQGIAWVKAGNFKAAAKHFPQVQQQYPEHEKMVRVVYYTGFAQARLKDWGSAAAQFKKLVENHPKSELADRALYEWAWCERELKHIKEATGIYQQLLAGYPGSSLSAKVHSELAELNLESGATEEVIAQLTKVMASVKDKALLEDIRYQLASAHFKDNDYKTAVDQFEGMLVDYPASKLLARILFHAGECRLELKDNTAAHDHFAAAAKIPGSPETLAESISMRLAETQANNGQHADAKATYAAFLGRFTESRWRRNAIFGLALATEMAGDPALAIPEYRKLMSAATVDLWTVRSRYQIGRCQVSLKQYEAAVVEFLSIGINHPQYPLWQARSSLEVGKLLMEQNKTAQAVAQFQDVIKRFKESEEAALAQNYIKQINSQ